MRVVLLILKITEEIKKGRRNFADPIAYMVELIRIELTTS